ncbi:UNVERIFIED_CONTAM: hypothetical protein FKN15_034201 [Acipenser sinensis]
MNGVQDGDREVAAAGQDESSGASAAISDPPGGTKHKAGGTPVTSGVSGGVQKETRRATLPGGASTWDLCPATGDLDAMAGCLGARG